jgi:hypothetical protein
MALSGALIGQRERKPPGLDIPIFDIVVVRTDHLDLSVSKYFLKLRKVP